MSSTTTQEEVTVQQLDADIASLRELKETYAKAKKLSDEASRAYKKQEAKVLDTLVALDKKSYISEAGRVTKVEKLSVKTPKTPEDRRAFFDWIRKNRGEDVADAYMTVNSNSLNSLFKELNEEYAMKGEVLQIDGLEDPTSYNQLSFTKS